ncbi:CAP domain-containing protein [Cohnella thermotolerans]|uniref:CAP domain-containing protein n=1 Tax=Cohnella thermotolerans TaxID=329858 RepID=UPI000A00E6FB|nr:CAP domain-containing protein [Cohnella thermotolerans]
MGVALSAITVALKIGEDHMVKKWIVMAALLLVAGCSNHSAVNEKQMVSKQASSISTTKPGKPTLKIRQAPDGAAGLIGGLLGDAAPMQPSAAPNANPPQTAGPSSSLTGNPSDAAQQVLGLVNQERSKAGLSPLSLNAQLSNVAMIKAKDMSDNRYFSHQSPTYGSPFDLMKANGIAYNVAGENIAQGQTSADEVMSQWMNSPGHRANILNGSYTQIGIAKYNDEWVQEFIG